MHEPATPENVDWYNRRAAHLEAALREHAPMIQWQVERFDPNEFPRALSIPDDWSIRASIRVGDQVLHNWQRFSRYLGRETGENLPALIAEEIGVAFGRYMARHKPLSSQPLPSPASGAAESRPFRAASGT